MCPELSVKEFLLAAPVGMVFAEESLVLVCTGPLDVASCRDKADENCVIQTLGVKFPGKCSGDTVSFESCRKQRGISSYPAARFCTFSPESTGTD